MPNRVGGKYTLLTIFEKLGKSLSMPQHRQNMEIQELRQSTHALGFSGLFGSTWQNDSKLGDIAF